MDRFGNCWGAGNTDSVTPPPPTRPGLARLLAACGVVAAVATVVGGCSASPAQIEIPELTVRSDAGLLADGGLAPPEGSRPCQTSADCDDGVDCTLDRCVDGGYCQNINDNAFCSDGDFCNGEEVCDFELDCLPPTRPESCDDRDVCTLDACDNLAQVCVHRPRDSDGDGEVDWHCPGGTDCDDFRPGVGAERPELCVDLIDNDCDGDVDEKGCGGPPHDTCADAFELSALDLESATTRELSTAGAARDYVLSCGAQTVRDVVYTFTLEAPADVELTAWGVLAEGSTETATVALRGVDCGAAPADLECAQGFPAYLRVRALPAGRYHVIVDSPGAEAVALRVTRWPATDAPDNQSCESARAFDDLGPARFLATGDFADVSDAHTPACAPQQPETPSQADLVYRYTLTQERDVSVLVSSLGGEQMTFSVRSDCGDPDSTLACRIAAPATARMRRQPPGDYFLIIESPSYREVDYALEVIFDPPSDPPAGDTCAVAEDLPLGAAVAGSLVGKQPGVAASCHEDFLAPDAVYRIVVEQPTDVQLLVDAEGSTVRMAVQGSCGDPLSELRCLVGSPAHARLRDLSPGEYFVAVDAPVPTAFSIQAELADRTIPIPASGNDVCASAAQVPADGAVFRGSTAALRNDYEGCADADMPDAAYRLELIKESAVTARLDADFDAVLYRYGAVCGASSRACNDDDPAGGTGASLLEEVLPPGVHHYIVDGRNGATGGAYVLEFEIDN